ncbi:MAG: helix-turn-helix domain-containing protein [Nitrospira sp.]|nr:helix-turn-helix domain-containing protein [Nitrospira sp.]
MDTTTTPQPDPALTDEVLTTEAAARFLKISLRTLQTMVRQGQLHPRRFGTKGRLWRFVRRELLAPQPTNPPAPLPLPLVTPRPGAEKRLQRIDRGLRYR